MNLLIKFFVSGAAFYPGAVLLIIGAFLSMKGTKNTFKVTSGIMFLIGILLVLLSGVPIPMFVFSLMAVMVAGLYFFTGFEGKETRLFFWIARLILICCVFYLTATDLKYRKSPVIRRDNLKKMYVIGTSLSLAHSGPSYVDILKKKYGIKAFNLSEPRNTPSLAMSQADLISSSDILILLELGMQDDYGDFRRELEELLKTLSGHRRVIMMFELPRLSSGGSFIKVQREMADKYGVILIPRRILAGVIYNWRQTNINNLSEKDHQQLAEYLAKIFKGCFRKEKHVDYTEKTNPQEIESAPVENEAKSK